MIYFEKMIKIVSLSQIEGFGGQAITFGGDMSKEADVDSMIKTVSNFFFPDLTSLCIYCLLICMIVIFTGH